MASCVPLGDRAVRFARPPTALPRAIIEAARAWPGVVDVVVGLRDVAVYFDRPSELDDAQIAALAFATVDATEPARDVELRAIYDGPDLDYVARIAQLSIDEVRAVHSGATYTVENMGFAPGFAYMTGLDPRLELPRRPAPRARVAAGSIAIARLHTAVYPFESPGGWHLLGRVVGAPMFGPEGPLLRLGDRVRFVS